MKKIAPVLLGLLLTILCIVVVTNAVSAQQKIPDAEFIVDSPSLPMDEVFFDYNSNPNEQDALPNKNKLEIAATNPAEYGLLGLLVVGIFYLLRTMMLNSQTQIPQLTHAIESLEKTFLELGNTLGRQLDSIENNVRRLEDRLNALEQKTKA